MLQDGRHITEYVFDISRQSGLKAIPVAAPLSMRGPGTDYFQAVSRVAGRDKRGVAVRIPYEDFENAAAIERALGEILELTAFSPQHVDVYLDALSLELAREDSGEEVALAQTLRKAAMTVRKLGYRRVVFAASNIPNSMTHHKKGEILKVARTEFRVWRRLVAEPEFKFLLFGDYGIIYPGQVESDAPVIPPSRVRTSSEDEYTFYKGPRDSIRTLSQVVMADGLLNDPSDSWGANAVRECAAGYGDPGGPSQWIARDTNMHIASTVTAITRYVPPDQMPSMQSNSKRGSPWLQESMGFTKNRK